MFLNVFVTARQHLGYWDKLQETHMPILKGALCTVHSQFAHWLDLWNPIKDQRVHNRSEGWLTAIHMRFNRFDMIWNSSWFVNNNCYWSIMPVKCKFAWLGYCQAFAWWLIQEHAATWLVKICYLSNNACMHNCLWLAIAKSVAAFSEAALPVLCFVLSISWLLSNFMEFEKISIKMWYFMLLNDHYTQFLGYYI